MAEKPNNFGQALDMLGESVGIYFKGFLPIFGLWAIAIFPLTIIQVLLFPKAALPVLQGVSVKVDPVTTVIIEGITTLVTLLLTMATVAMADAIRQGQEMGEGAAYLAALRRYLPALATTLGMVIVACAPAGVFLLAGSFLPGIYAQVILTAAGMLLLLISFVFVVPMVFLVPPVVWHDNIWWWKAAQRVLVLLNKRWWLAWLAIIGGLAGVFVAYGTGGLIAMLTSEALMYMVGSTDPMHSTGGLSLFAVLLTILGIAIQPVLSILSVVLYRRLGASIVEEPTAEPVMEAPAEEP